MKINRKILLMAGLVWIVASTSFGQGEDNIQKDRDRRKDDKAINTRQPTPTKIIEFIVGEWEAEDVYKGSQEVTNTDTLGTGDLIHFNREGQYTQYTGAEKLDSGSYRINEQHALLYLESADGSEPTTWKVNFSEDGRMYLRKRDDTAAAESFKYVYRRRTKY
jgi:hypothetical protein